MKEYKTDRKERKQVCKGEEGKKPYTIHSKKKKIQSKTKFHI